MPKIYAIHRGKRIPYILGVLIAFDQFINALFPKADIDETISSRIGRAERDGRMGHKPILRIISWLLDKVDKDHCKKSIGY
jgi:hypothetical protein